MRSRLGLAVRVGVVAVFVVVAAGCDWATFHGGLPGRATPRLSPRSVPATSVC